MARKKHPAATPPRARPPAPAIPAAEPVPSAPGAFNWKTAGALFALALGVRLIALGHADLWCDEILFVSRTHAPRPFLQVLYRCWVDLLLVTHLPFAEMVQNLYLWLCYPFATDLIHNAWLQRLPAALWGAGSVVALYSLCAKLFRPATTLIAALTMCFFFYPVYYSREAYYYAPLIFFAAATLNLYVEMIIRGQQARRRAAWFVFCLSALVLTHLTGTLFGGLLLVLHLGYLAHLKFIRKAPAPCGAQSLRLFVLPLLLALPFIIKLGTQPIEAGMGGASMNVPQIIYYVLGKFTLGTAFIWPVVGGLILLAGAVHGIGKGAHRDARVLLTGLMLASLLVFSYIQTRTQFNVRYFNALLPGLICLWAAGIEALARGCGKLAKAGPAFENRAIYSLGSLFILAHLLFFLPPMYRLRAKSRDFGGAARWLTAHLPPGTPYFFETGGWDRRFVPEFYPTPGLAFTVNAAWNGPDFEEAKRRQQSEIIAQFPESACVEYMDYQWPKLPLVYRQKAEIHNREVMQLIRRGIWFEAPFAHAPARAPGDMNIWYNTREDAIAQFRSVGEPAYFAFENMECAQIAPDVYLHAAQGNRAVIRVHNLAGQPVKGRFHITSALNTSQEGCPFYIAWQNQVIVQTSAVRRSTLQIETPDIILPAGEHPLTLRAEPRAGGQVLNVAVARIAFHPAP